MLNRIEYCNITFGKIHLLNLTNRQCKNNSLYELILLLINYYEEVYEAARVNKIYFFEVYWDVNN